MSQATALLISRCLMDWEASYDDIQDLYVLENETDTSVRFEISASEIDTDNPVMATVQALGRLRGGGG